ncbi:MAG: hypothetical protein WC852_02750 [Candidatus Nanoarchaeia archaeon]|jgi:hypothetical protein
MEEQSKGGLEAIVSKDTPVQKKPAHNRFLRIARQLPNYVITAVAGLGLAVSLYFAGMSTYKGIDEFLLIDENAVEAAKSSEEPSPYNGCIVYGMILGMCLMSGAAFGYATVASIKEAKEKMQEEKEKKGL